MPATSEHRPDTMGEIAADRSYAIEQFKRLVGLSQWAMRMARRQGLKVRKVGRRHYVLGRDWIAFLEKQEG